MVDFSLSRVLAPVSLLRLSDLAQKSSLRVDQPVTTAVPNHEEALRSKAVRGCGFQVADEYFVAVLARKLAFTT